MANKGPIPKRAEARHGHRAKGEATSSITRGPSAPVVEVPAADPSWHALAADWFGSLAESGQAAWYQPSDWQTARIWAELLSRQLSSERLSAVMIQAWASAAGELLTTEGARRRARLELDRVSVRDSDEDAAVLALDLYRTALGVQSDPSGPA